MKTPSVTLAKTHLEGLINGADAVFVSYALHLHRAGHLRSVVLLYAPPSSAAGVDRLRRASIHVVVVHRARRALAGFRRRLYAPAGAAAPLHRRAVDRRRAAANHWSRARRRGATAFPGALLA